MQHTHGAPLSYQAAWPLDDVGPNGQRIGNDWHPVLSERPVSPIRGAPGLPAWSPVPERTSWLQLLEVGLVAAADSIDCLGSGSR
ncbi:hypothetical protein SUNI508_08398 [Seiridium unicorne]|uniref:Uncharacterized protein n=1 Tax=Seiridium unicorne TaxID=138068 RepID=A0ABR2UU72_9PEZI